MRLLRALITSLALAAVAMPAAAADQPSRLTRHAGRADAAEVVTIWAECVARIEGKWARELLATLPTTAEEKAVLDKHDGDNDRCLTESRLIMRGKQVTFTPETARGEIALHLVRLQKDARPLPGAGTAWLRDQLARYPDPSSYDRTALIGHQFALCVVDEHWDAARALMLAPRASKQESAAVAALGPKLPGCMAAGANLKLTKPILRVLIGEAAYQALNHKPSGLAGGGIR